MATHKFRSANGSHFIFSSTRCLSDMWWTLNTESDDADDDRILALWLNSTLGLLLWVYASEETQGPWLQLKKNKLNDMTVLDAARLSAAARGQLLECGHKVKDEDLAAISKSDDPVSP